MTSAENPDGIASQELRQALPDFSRALSLFIGNPVEWDAHHNSHSNEKSGRFLPFRLPRRSALRLDVGDSHPVGPLLDLALQEGLRLCNCRDPRVAGDAV